MNFFFLIFFKCIKNYNYFFIVIIKKFDIDKKIKIVLLEVFFFFLW